MCNSCSNASFKYLSSVRKLEIVSSDRIIRLLSLLMKQFDIYLTDEFSMYTNYMEVVPATTEHKSKLLMEFLYKSIQFELREELSQIRSSSKRAPCFYHLTWRPYFADRDMTTGTLQLRMTLLFLEVKFQKKN